MNRCLFSTIDETGFQGRGETTSVNKLHEQQPPMEI
jgi:hypothetical protein